MTFIKTKGVGGHLEFGNGERIKFDWTKTQDCDPGELKGPPKCFCRLWSRGYYISALFSHPRPRARASATQHSHSPKAILSLRCAGLWCPAFLGFVVYVYPILFPLRGVINTCLVST